MDKFFTDLIACLIVGSFSSWIIKLLWNSCLVPTVSGVRNITFWKAWGLLLLTGFFFGTTTIIEHIG